MLCDNPKLGIVNNNMYAKYDPNPSILSQDIERKPILRAPNSAHLHTMAKTSVKFQNDWRKTVGEVALTRHPLTIRVLVLPTDYKGFR